MYLEGVASKYSLTVIAPNNTSQEQAYLRSKCVCCELWHAQVQTLGPSVRYDSATICRRALAEAWWSCGTARGRGELA